MGVSVVYSDQFCVFWCLLFADSVLQLCMYIRRTMGQTFSLVNHCSRKILTFNMTQSGSGWRRKVSTQNSMQGKGVEANYTREISHVCWYWLLAVLMAPSRPACLPISKDFYCVYGRRVYCAMTSLPIFLDHTLRCCKSFSFVFRRYWASQSSHRIDTRSYGAAVATLLQDLARG